MSEILKKKTLISRFRNFVFYVAGSAAMIIVISKVAPYISGAINKEMSKINNAKKPEENFGPVIEKKHTDKNVEEK